MPENATKRPSAKNKRIFPSQMGGIGRFVLAFLAIGFLAANVRAESPNDKFDEPSISSPSDQSASTEGEIEVLLAQLDAQDFAKRELASDKLAAIGEPAIGPLAYHSFDCSPESCWRIKKTLEKICTSGTEPVFFKAIAVLNLRFNLGGHNNPELAKSLATLENKWRQKRKQQAIARLRESGATVLDPLENAGAEFQQLQMWRGQDLIVFNNTRSRQFVDANAKSKKTPRKKLSEKKLKAEIKLILESDVDANRELVFGNGADSQPEVADMNEIEDVFAAQLAMRNQLRANQFRLAGIPQQSNGPGVTITFDEKWKGESADLNLLEQVDNVQQINFKNQSITRDLIGKTSNLATLKKIVLDDCEFDSRAFDNASWTNLNEIECKNQEITSKLIAACAEIPSLQSMMFDACKFEGRVFKGLAKSKSLRVLQFNEAEFDDSVFKSLAKLNKLSYINLTACKFETDDYKFLRAARPTLQIRFTAKSFFGVRGPVNVGVERFRLDDNGKLIAPDAESESECEITDVIAGSGAQKAGMKVGDVVESVNGQKIGTFEDLRLHIAQHQAGDMLKVTVRRGKKTVKLDVELGSQKNAPRFMP